MNSPPPLPVDAHRPPPLETFKTLSAGPGTFRKQDQPTVILSQGSGTFRAVSEGPGTFREQRQTTGNDSKMTKIMKIVENELIFVEMG